MTHHNHTCTMFCACPVARRTAGGTAAEREPYRPPTNAPTSPRDAAIRGEAATRAAVHVRDDR